MKTAILNFMKKLLGAIGLLGILLLIYMFFLSREIKAVDDFCSEMKPGLDLTKISSVAEKYNVGFKNIRDPNSVKNGTLGIKIKDKENTWFFAVASPMTIGEHACGVYHNNQVVLSASSGR